MNFTKTEREQIYTAALHKWGARAQIDIAIEEMAELIKALSKQKRAGSQEEIMTSIREEIADVEIVIEQLRALFDSAVDAEDSIDKIKALKLQRLTELINR